MPTKTATPRTMPAVVRIVRSACFRKYGQLINLRRITVRLLGFAPTDRGLLAEEHIRHHQVGIAVRMAWRGVFQELAVNQIRVPRSNLELRRGGVGRLDVTLLADMA